MPPHRSPRGGHGSLWVPWGGPCVPKGPPMGPPGDQWVPWAHSGNPIAPTLGPPLHLSWELNGTPPGIPWDRPGPPGQFFLPPGKMYRRQYYLIDSWNRGCGEYPRYPGVYPRPLGYPGPQGYPGVPCLRGTPRVPLHGVPRGPPDHRFTAAHIVLDPLRAPSVDHQVG